MAAKKTVTTKSGYDLAMYEKSFVMGPHTLYLKQPVDAEMLKVLLAMLNTAFSAGVRHNKSHVAQTLHSLLDD